MENEKNLVVGRLSNYIAFCFDIRKNQFHKIRNNLIYHRYLSMLIDIFWQTLRGLPFIQQGSDNSRICGVMETKARGGSVVNFSVNE